MRSSKGLHMLVRRLMHHTQTPAMLLQMRNKLELHSAQFTKAETGPDAFAGISHCSQVPQCYCKGFTPLPATPKSPNSRSSSLWSCVPQAQERACTGWKMRREHLVEGNQLSTVCGHALVRARGTPPPGKPDDETRTEKFSGFLPL